MAKIQRERFKRLVRRVFNSVKLKPGGVLNHMQRLSIARKKKFLFLESQQFKHRISHLVYKQAR